MPEPQVKRGTKVKPRSRNKDGTWRKKRSDVGKHRKKVPSGEIIGLVIEQPGVELSLEDMRREIEFHQYEINKAKEGITQRQARVSELESRMDNLKRDGKEDETH
jgi:hypothetical protein